MYVTLNLSVNYVKCTRVRAVGAQSLTHSFHRITWDHRHLNRRGADHMDNVCKVANPLAYVKDYVAIFPSL